MNTGAAVVSARILCVAPLAVDPEAVWAAGSAVVAVGDGVATALRPLAAGFAANTGQDVAGEVFGLAYQAEAAAINACRHSGAKIQLCASNYSKAEAASTLGGGAAVLPAPGEPVKATVPGPRDVGAGAAPSAAVGVGAVIHRRFVVERRGRRRAASGGGLLARFWWRTSRGAGCASPIPAVPVHPEAIPRCG